MNHSTDILDSYSAAGTPPEEILSRIDNDIRDAYWKSKDLPRVMVLGKAGMAYALQLADEKTGNRDHYLQSAKTMAYNIASFSWPGWDEPGIVITEDDLKYGFICAKLNLQLAIELNRPAEKIADADWLIGAHRLAQSDWQAALDAFLHADAANSKLLTKGYILLARRCLQDLQAQLEWDEMMKQLNTKDNHQSFVREQLITAAKVFLTKSA